MGTCMFNDAWLKSDKEASVVKRVKGTGPG